MTANDNKTNDFVTFPRTFEKYKWYKPILVFLIGGLLFLIIGAIVTVIFCVVYGWEPILSIMNGGYEALDTALGQIFSDVGIIILIPCLYLATKIVKDRPFSSYSSSRGGWNFKLYFKALIIPLIANIILGSIEIAIKGPQGVYHFSILFLITTLILVPLQCIAEEYIFRGLFLQTFGSWFKIPILAVIIQAIIFALSHGYNSIGLMEILVSGLVLGFFAWKTNGIEVSSALHTANNLSIALFVMFGLKSSTSSPTLNDVVIAIVFEIVLCIVMYYVGKKTDWFGEIEENSQNT